MPLPKTFIRKKITFPRSSSVSGFTLLEVLVVIGILLIVAGMGLFVSIGFYKSYSFNSERANIVSIIHKARMQALSNIDQAKHGVYFQPASYTVFEGDSYAAANHAKDIIWPASPAVVKSGLSEVVFDQLTGDAAPVGGNILVLSDGVRTASVSVNAEGRIDW